MPVVRVKSGPEDNDADVLEKAVTALEAKGIEVTGMQFFGAFPVGEFVLLTKKGSRPPREHR